MCFERTDYKSKHGHPDTTIEERSNQVLDKLFEDLVTTGTCVSRISMTDIQKNSIIAQELYDSVDKNKLSNEFRTQEMFEEYCFLKDFYDKSQQSEQPNEAIDPTQFIKLDTGKRRLSLLEPHFILSVGDVITFGAQKYAPNNWQLCEDTSRYKDALLRHIYAYLSGERYDQETGIEHIAHASCNLMFLQYFDNLNKDQQ